MAVDVAHGGLINRFGEKLRKLTQRHKGRPHDNNTFDEWYEILRSTARREGVSTATLASADDLLKELFKRGLSASEALDCLKKDEWIRNTLREDGI
jgi:hypothetical protein